MSDFNTFNTTGPGQGHHIHNNSDPLPGTQGAPPTVDYTPQTMENARIPSNDSDLMMGASTDTPLRQDSSQFANQGSSQYPPTSQTFQPTGQVDSNTEGFGKRYEVPSSDGAMGDDLPGSERPMHAQSKQHGSVSIGGEPDTQRNANLPESKPTFEDKLMGKVEKLAGKLGKNPEKEQRGELRATAGKAAVTGQARAPDNL